MSSTAGATADIRNSYEEEIYSCREESEVDDRRLFIPARCIHELVEAQPATIRALLPTASQELIDFVCGPAQKLFLTLWQAPYQPELVEVLEEFRSYDFDDEYLPIEDITDAGDHECKLHIIRRKRRVAGASEEVTCKHSPVLDVFHHKRWTIGSLTQFRHRQWMFTAPIFTEDRILEELVTGCILPFTWKSRDERSGHFGTVQEVGLHIDHQDVLELVRPG